MLRRFQPLNFVHQSSPGNPAAGSSALFFNTAGVPTVRESSGVESPLAVVKNTWVTASLGNGWSAYGNGFAPPRYCKMSDGTGMIEGVCTGGTTTSGTVLFTLPSDMWPPEHHTYICAVNGGSFMQIRVNSNGTVALQTTPAGVSWVDLDGIRWRII